MRYSAGRIKRGHFGGDGFTQVSNALFRDRRISAKAKGVFGLMSTHRDDYGLTVKSLMRDLKEGRDAVDGAMLELERYGYLTRTRERREDGTLSDIVYEITDTPDSDRQNPSSEPIAVNPEQGLTSGNTDDDSPDGDSEAAVAPKPAPEPQIPRSEPVRDFPDLDNPDQVNPDTKKTNLQNIIFEKTNQAGSACVRETVAAAGADPACLPAYVDNEPETSTRRRGGGRDPETAGARLLSRLPSQLATPQVIGQHHTAVDALLRCWPEEQLYRRLVLECDGRVGPGRLVRAIRDTPSGPPVSARPVVVVDGAAPAAAPVRLLSREALDARWSAVDDRFKPSRMRGPTRAPESHSPAPGAAR